MSRTYKDSRKVNGRAGREHRVSVRAVRRDPPDLRKLARALIELAMAEAEADAQAETEARARRRASRRTPPADEDQDV